MNSAEFTSYCFVALYLPALRGHIPTVICEISLHQSSRSRKIKKVSLVTGDDHYFAGWLSLQIADSAPDVDARLLANTVQYARNRSQTGNGVPLCAVSGQTGCKVLWVSQGMVKHSFPN